MPQQGQTFDIDTVAQKYALDPDILRKQITQESGGNPRAVSPKGAMGLMQLMPENAKDIDPYDPAANVERGASIMGRLVKKYGGDYSKALAAYNAGEGAVDKGKTLPAETQAYVRGIMGGRPPVQIQNPKSFLDIASSFPPDMSQDTYDSARAKYFQDVMVPQIKPEESIGATWKAFKAQTERPHLLTTSGRAAAAAQLGAVSAAKAVVAPLTALDSLTGANTQGKYGSGPVSGLQSDLSVKEDELTRIGDREGLNTKVLKVSGSVAGQVVGFEALGMVASPIADEIAGSFATSARTAKLASSTIRGGMAFGTYDALSDTDGNRMVAGLKGFGLGAAFDLALGTPGFLLKRGVVASRDAADTLATNAAVGVKPPPAVDGALAQKATSDAGVARAEGRSNEIKFSNQAGARVYVTDVAGNTQPLEIKQYREADTYRQVSNIVAQGGHVSHFEVNPENQKVLNEYLRMQTNIEAAKYKGTTLRTPDGQAPAVARAANDVGLPAEALAPDTVHVATVTHEVPESAPIKPKGVGEAPVVPEARKAPTPEEVDAHLATQDVAPKDRAFVGRSIEKAWDPDIPTSDKQREIQVALKYAPHMLPPEYTEYALPRITSKHSYMFGQVDANAVSDKVSRIGAEALGYPIRVMDVVTGENPNRVKVFLKGNVDPDVNESVKNVLQGKLGPAYDIAFSSAPQGRRFDILGARTDAPRVQSDDAIEEALKFHDVKPSDVDVDKLSRMTSEEMARELDATRARLSDIAKGENIAENRPRVVSETKRVEPSKYVPPSEQSRVSVGGNIARDIEESTGSKFLDQGVVLRSRPGGPKLILSPERMEQIGPGAEAASHPNLQNVLKQLGVETPASMANAEPVTLLQEGKIHPMYVYHEDLHSNMYRAGVFDSLPTLMPPSIRGTATDLMTGLKKTYDAYGESSRINMLNEAYVHAAQAIRFNDEGYLDELAKMDTSVDKVKEFVNETSKGVLQRSIDDAKDSIPVRNLQRSATDLIRRTDPAVSYELNGGARITGSGSDTWYEPARGWVLQESADSQRVFGTKQELLDHIDGNDKNFLSPSYSFMPEQAGVRGGMTPPGAEPDGSRPPNPEVPLGRRFAWSGLSAIWRPTLPWAASLDNAVNKVFRAKGINLPIYDSFKDVDDMVRSGDRWMQSMSEKSGELLDSFDQKKLYDAAQYLTHPEVERTQGLMDKYSLSKEDAQKLHLYGDYLKQYQADTGIDALGFLRRDYPRLRMHQWDPSGVWGPGISEKNAGFWEKAVRYDKTLDPSDLNLGRFNQFLLREGMLKKFTAEPLNKLNALINRKDAAGELLLPNNVRYPMTNYRNYMKGIPDNSQQAIQQGLGRFFDVLNERGAALNDKLPDSVQIPKITMQPKQVINRMMILSYAMGLGARPAIAVRDGLWSLISSSVFLGPGRMTRALMESFKPEAWVRATKAGALLSTKNVGELYGDIINEIPSGGKNLFDRVTNWSNMLLAPSRWAHNFGRNIMFNGEYLDALDAVRDYRSGKATIDTFFDRTTLAAMDKPAQNRLLRFVNDKTMSPESIATKFGLDAVDIAEWPYRRGTQPMALRYGAGRILGQYGVWPANYLDFGARTTKLMFTNPRVGVRMAAMWGATNFAASTAMEHVGVDSSKWFFLSPMGYAGSPQLEFVQNAMKAPEDTQEGREARRAVLEYPLNFAPAAAEVESILKGMSEPGGDQWPPTGRQFTRMLGFKPLDEHVQDRDWQAWLRYQTGFPKAKP